METIYLSLRAQVAVGTFFMKSLVPREQVKIRAFLTDGRVRQGARRLTPCLAKHSILFLINFSFTTKFFLSKSSISSLSCFKNKYIFINIKKKQKKKHVILKEATTGGRPNPIFGAVTEFQTGEEGMVRIQALNHKSVKVGQYRFKSLSILININ